MCVSVFVCVFQGTHLSHASVGVPHLDDHRVGRGCNLQTRTIRLLAGVITLVFP